MGRRIDLGAIVVALAGLLVAFALAVAAIPETAGYLPASLRSLDARFDAEPLLRGAGALGVVLAVLVVLSVTGQRHRRSTDGPEPLRPELADDAQEPTASDAETGIFDEESWTSYGDAGRGRPVGESITRAYERRRDSLRSATGCPRPEPTDGLERAAVALQLARGVEPATAHDRIRRGAWTDDPVAAAFLGGPEAGSISLRRRLYGVFFPARSFERRFERTLSELEAQGVGGRGAAARDRAPGHTARDLLEGRAGASGRAPDGGADSTDGGATSPEEVS